MKKKIAWITPDYFYCADACIVPNLSHDFDIHWFLINTKDAKRKTVPAAYENIHQYPVDLKYRQRDPRIIFQYLSILWKIRKMNTDLVYLSFHGLPFFFPLFFLLIDKKKVIYAAHNVSTPKGASNEKFMRVYQDYAFKRISRFHVFSKYQLQVIREMLPGKSHYYAPFVLEEYGKSDVAPGPKPIRFLFFGYIRKYKRLDLMLQAFQQLIDMGYKDIELIIAGNCENWEEYAPLIRYPEFIKCRVEVIPNNDIPDLVSSCHYMVLPYQDGAQSAVLTLAYQYNKPVIVSNINSFKQFVKENETGYYFTSESVESLVEVLKYAIDHFDTDYHRLTGNIPQLVEQEFALDSITEKYKSFLSQGVA